MKRQKTNLKGEKAGRGAGSLVLQKNARDISPEQLRRNDEFITNVNGALFSAIDFVYDAMKSQNDEEFTRAFSAALYQTGSFAVLSNGMIDGYILAKDWFAVPFAQFAFLGGREKAETFRAAVRENLLRRYALLNLEIDLILNPKESDCKKLVRVETRIGEKDQFEYFLLFEKLFGVVSGAKLKSKHGNIYKLGKATKGGYISAENVASGKRYAFPRSLLLKTEFL